MPGLTASRETGAAERLVRWSGPGLIHGPGAGPDDLAEPSPGTPLVTDGGVTELMALLGREDPIASCERDIADARAKQKQADGAADEAGWAVATARLNYHLDRYQKLTRAEPTAAAR